MLHPFCALLAAIGLFSQQSDVGGPSHPGTAAYDPASRVYTVGGAGANMWFNQDSFHFVWKRMTGDFLLAAHLDFEGRSAQGHRKAILMIRQSLAPDAAYADAAVHGDGLVSLQFRLAAGETTHEIQSTATGPGTFGIERIGGTVYLLVAGPDGKLQPAGSSVPIALGKTVLVGLGVCAHDPQAFETAQFSNVVMGPPIASVVAVRSSLEYVKVPSGDRRSVYHTDAIIEAPNWTRDGAALIFNGGGRLHRFDLAGGAEPALIDTGSCTRCNNDHGLSPDGSLLAISDHSQDDHSRIYVLPAGGGTPREITPGAPSYWHGWSPDGATLAFCGQRDGKFGIFTVPAAGGPEKRLTTAEGLDDGPDYSPDGRWIYFNSDRTGRMQIWRMHPDASGLEQVTRDGDNNWFAHPSPDGKWIVILSYGPEVKGHPPDKDVRLRLIPMEGDRPAVEKIRVLVELFGGQGTINVPSWAPDSSKLAYVRYQPPTQSEHGR